MKIDTVADQTPADGTERRRPALVRSVAVVALVVACVAAVVIRQGPDEEYEAARAAVAQVGGPAGWPAVPEFEGVFAVADPGPIDTPGDPLRVREGDFEVQKAPHGEPTAIMGRYEIVFDAVESRQRCQELSDWLRRAATNDTDLTVEGCAAGLRSDATSDGLLLGSTSWGTAADPNLQFASFTHSSPRSSRRVMVAAVTRPVVRERD